MLEIIFNVTLCGILGVLGSVASVINIVVFVKQRINDSVNISLCGLAVSDLGLLLTLVWTSVFYNPLFGLSKIKLDPSMAKYINSGWPHGGFVRTTSWITAYITLERCVCVALPMQVKIIITPTRTLITIITIFLVMFASIIPVYCSVACVPSDRGNKTQASNFNLENIAGTFNLVAQLTAIIFISICTVILFNILRIKSQWRNKIISSSANSHSVSIRDHRVMKMVISIVCIFIVCYFPSAVNLLLMTQFTTDYIARGTFHNSFIASWSILSALEAINSSVNILIYYNMSSKFRHTFNHIFCINSLDVDVLLGRRGKNTNE